MKAWGLLPAMIVSLWAQVLPAQPGSCSVPALVTVLDRKSHLPIDGLTPADFRATLKGHDLSISISPAPQSRRFVFVLDRSASMNHAPFENDDPNFLVKQILDDSISAVRKTDSIAFLLFAGDSSSHTAFVDPGLVAAKANALLNWKPEGKQTHRTPLWDNLHAALELLGNPRKGDVIVVVSDGGDNESKLRESDVRNELVAAHVTVLAMMRIDPFAVLPEESLGPLYLQEIAKMTGGAATVSSTPRAVLDSNVIIPVRPSDLIRQLSHQYAIEVSSPNVHGMEKWKLEVASSRVAGPKQLLYPRYLSPCDAMRKASK